MTIANCQLKMMCVRSTLSSLIGNWQFVVDQDNIHVMVVSRQFDGLSEKQKQDLMWQIVDAADLSDAEKRLISLLYPVSPAEMK